MYNKQDVVAMLEAYHHTISSEPVNHVILSEFVEEYLMDVDHIVEKSYEVDFNFDDL